MELLLYFIHLVFTVIFSIYKYILIIAIVFMQYSAIGASRLEELLQCHGEHLDNTDVCYLLHVLFSILQGVSLPGQLTVTSLLFTGFKHNRFFLKP